MKTIHSKLTHLLLAGAAIFVLKPSAVWSQNGEEEFFDARDSEYTGVEESLDILLKGIAPQHIELLWQGDPEALLILRERFNQANLNAVQKKEALDHIKNRLSTLPNSTMENTRLVSRILKTLEEDQLEFFDAVESFDESDKSKGHSPDSGVVSDTAIPDDLSEQSADEDLERENFSEDAEGDRLEDLKITSDQNDPYFGTIGEEEGGFIEDSPFGDVSELERSNPYDLSQPINKPFEKSPRNDLDAGLTEPLNDLFEPTLSLEQDRQARYYQLAVETLGKISTASSKRNPIELRKAILYVNGVAQDKKQALGAKIDAAIQALPKSQVKLKLLNLREKATAHEIAMEQAKQGRDAEAMEEARTKYGRSEVSKTIRPEAPNREDLLMHQIQAELRRIYPHQRDAQETAFSEIERDLPTLSLEGEMADPKSAVVLTNSANRRAKLSRVIKRLKAQEIQSAEAIEDDDMPIHAETEKPWPAMTGVDPATQKINKLSARSNGAELWKRKKASVKAEDISQEDVIPKELPAKVLQRAQIEELDDVQPIQIDARQKNDMHVSKPVLSAEDVRVIHAGHQALNKSIEALSYALRNFNLSIRKLNIKHSIQQDAQKLIDAILNGKSYDGKVSHKRVGGIVYLRTLQSGSQTHDLEVLDGKNRTISGIKSNLAQLYRLLTKVKLVGKPAAVLEQMIDALREAENDLVRAYDTQSGTLVAAFDAAPDTKLRYDEGRDETIADDE